MISATAACSGKTSTAERLSSAAAAARQSTGVVCVGEERLSHGGVARSSSSSIAAGLTLCPPLDCDKLLSPSRSSFLKCKTPIRGRHARRENGGRRKGALEYIQRGVDLERAGVGGSRRPWRGARDNLGLGRGTKNNDGRGERERARPASTAGMLFGGCGGARREDPGAKTPSTMGRGACGLVGVCGPGLGLGRRRFKRPTAFKFSASLTGKLGDAAKL